MIFHPQSTAMTEGSFLVSGEVTATAHACLDKNILREFWFHFTYQASWLTLKQSSSCRFTLGNAAPLPLDGAAYSIRVTPCGVCILAETAENLRLGFLTLLDRIRAIDTEDGIACAIDSCEIRDTPIIQNRMVHYCVFPETELWELQRFLRFCGALKYTHVVLEFWGMLKYDCLRELSWAHGFTKEQLRPILREAKELGLEIVPMFNHWGHASAGRVMHGKHVLLDQNPTLQTYFSEDGWCWAIEKPKVKQLLREIRRELIELCGEGSYFHIGCDEAFNFVFTKESMDFICDFINEISREMQEQNRRVIAWGDMFLCRREDFRTKNQYTCFSPSPEASQYMIERLDRRVLIADWQYDAVEAPVETAKVFTDAGFDCLLCPWDRGNAQMHAVMTTVKEQSLTGFLHTTWHTLSSGFSYVALAAVYGFENIEGIDKTAIRIHSAALLRKVLPCGGDYEKAGWSRMQVHYKW